MKVLNTRVHGMIDYLAGTLLIASPRLFDFANGGMEQKIPVSMGIVILSMSLLTNYELGMIRIIPIRIHIISEILAFFFLALSPFIFDFSERIYIPHLALGILMIIISVLTIPVAYTHREHHRTFHI